MSQFLALDLGRGANPKSYMVEEIWKELAKAKYLEWDRESSRRTWELKKLKEACESALKEKHELDSSQMEGFIDDRSTSLLKQLVSLGGVFRKAAEDDTPTEVPDYLCCKITLDIFRDPVITPSGVTYEKAVILDHLQKLVFVLFSMDLDANDTSTVECSTGTDLDLSNQQNDNSLGAHFLD
ncbi:hypothetical protein K7X08_028215 [Anisodus acutangulus]|uniref:RING-type E3 ubiquitin transferase n=1 Tax=Anisodus acutangulus TaxID=402998 RepID=A0A9Q1N0C3_9SOLA|nr:hypothetical protein K7X08_028215 [Anisodus acutangulus]